MLSMQVPTWIAVIATFAEADGFGAPVKLLLPAGTASSSVGDLLEMTCNVTDPGLRVRDVRWFHVRGRVGSHRPRHKPDLVKRSSNMETMKILKFSVSRGMEGQYYCLVNSVFRSNTVRLFVQSKSAYSEASSMKQTSLAENDISSGLSRSERELLAAITVTVLFIAAIITSFYCGRHLRGRRAISPDTSRKMEEALQQATRAKQGALGEVVTLAGQIEENVEKILHMLQRSISQTRRTSGNNISGSNMTMSLQP